MTGNGCGLETEQGVDNRHRQGEEQRATQRHGRVPDAVLVEHPRGIEHERERGENQQLLDEIQKRLDGGRDIRRRQQGGRQAEAEVKPGQRMQWAEMGERS